MPGKNRPVKQVSIGMSLTGPPLEIGAVHMVIFECMWHLPFSNFCLHPVACSISTSVFKAPCRTLIGYLMVEKMCVISKKDDVACACSVMNQSRFA